MSIYYERIYYGASKSSYVSLVENEPPKVKKKEKKGKKSKKRKYVGRIILLVLLAFVLGFGIFNINARMVLRDPFPMVAGYGMSVVLSGSMEPTLHVNDVLIVQEQEDYEPDDIIVFVDQKEGTVAHRLLSKNDDGTVVTKGDANNSTDKTFDISNIRGKVIVSIPMIGAAANSYVKMGLMFVLLILLILSFIGEGKSRHKDKDNIIAMRKEIERLKKQNNA